MFIRYILNSEHQPRLLEFINEQIRPNSFIIDVCILLDGDNKKINQGICICQVVKKENQIWEELSVKREEIYVNAQTVQSFSIKP